MHHLTKLTIAALAATSLGVAATGGAAGASTTTKKKTSAPRVTVTGAWARVTAPEQKTGAIYMTIKSKRADRLLSARVPKSIAGRAELHETTDTPGAMGEHMKGMRKVSSIPIPARRAVALKPGGYHVMLFDLAKPITAGQRIRVTLKFKKAGTVKVTAVAREA